MTSQAINSTPAKSFGSMQRHRHEAQVNFTSPRSLNKINKLFQRSIVESHYKIPISICKSLKKHVKKSDTKKKGKEKISIQKKIPIPFVSVQMHHLSCRGCEKKKKLSPCLSLQFSCYNLIMPNKFRKH